MGGETPESQPAAPGVTMPAGVPADFDPVSEAKRLLRSIRAGALATLTPDGFPLATLVNVATAFDGSPVLLMSGLSAHTKNLAAEPRASVLLSEGGKGDPLAHARLTVVGTVVRIDNADARAALKARFLARHPKSALYADFGDFAFWRFGVKRALLNGGFARAAEFTAEALLSDVSGAGELETIEADALAHMNADHAEAVRLYATRLLGEKDGRWRATGVDPDGMDLALGDLTTRLPFPKRVTDGNQLRGVLASLGKQARDAAAK
jgi:putative heme iron utilization protein